MQVRSAGLQEKSDETAEYQAMSSWSVLCVMKEGSIASVKVFGTAGLHAQIYYFKYLYRHCLPELLI